MNILKRWALNVALRILGGPHLPIDFDRMEHKKIKVKPLKDWLFTSNDEEGWKNYYSYRNYELMEAAGLSKDHEAHLIIVGRLFELRQLRENMKLAVRRKKDDQRKKAEQEQREKVKNKIR